MIDENMPETEYRDFLFACERGDLDKVEYFVEKYDCANGFLRKGSWYYRPLIKSAVYKKIKIVEYLISKGANVNEYQLVHDNNGKVENLKIPLLSRLIISESEDVGGEWEVDSFESATKLLKKRKMVQLFIDNGADINKPDDEGYTPLDWSVLAIHKPALDLLSSLGAKHSKRYLIDRKKTNYSKFDDYINAPYFIKESTNLHKEIERTFNSSIKYKKALYLGFIEDCYKEDKNNLNKKDYLGRTPLDFAIELGHTLAEEYLKEHGGKTSKELEDESKS